MTIKSKIIELANSYSKTLQEKIAQQRYVLKCNGESIRQPYLK